ncbi:S49 family peptidase [Neomegalonema sp.]|uniref:S49 family peptidase n=1 Tax=Neomegalonema sp. TaxID=2039713 RepID=UPI00262AAD9C|nr:S49 family peptidase [Neomegalonema sp.]MDD2867147.1 S49 family peptidase [Neomegalonema sp.]
MSLAERFQRLRKRLTSPGPVVPVIRLQGVIAANSGGIGSGPTLNHARLAPAIERAFSGKPAAVALAINSPGGSPTQSALIAEDIRRRADEKGIKVYAFCEDVAASGGYMLAVSADEIWADRYSLLGSIGAIMAGFGFPEALEKLGVERRVYRAGENKDLMDPFRPARPEDRERAERLLRDIHAGFIDWVKARRAGRLDEQTPNLFEGEVWTSPDALRIGLIDGIGHMAPVLREKLGAEPRFRLANPARRGFLGRRFGMEMAEGALGALETRVEFGRFGR